MPYHRGAAAAIGRIAHLDRLPRIHRERLFAEHMLAGFKRRNGELVVRPRWRCNSNRVQVPSGDELQRIGMHIADAGRLGNLGSLVAAAAADRRDLPAFGAEGGEIDLSAKAKADDPDAAIESGHGVLRRLSCRRARGPSTSEQTSHSV